MTPILNKLGRCAPAGAVLSWMLMLGAVACGTTGGDASSPSGQVQVVAAESFWGSIAAQVGGPHANVVSIIGNPDTDPHEYEPTPQDGRTVAEAGYVVLNGAGYDHWATGLVEANPVAGRRVLSVAGVAGRREGDNPHMWYSPTIVRQVVERIAVDLAAIDPAHASDFHRQAAAFEATSLRRYDTLRAFIRSAHHGVAVGATESLVIDLVRDLGLNLVTPAGYLTAISEGNEPTVADRSEFDRQIAGGAIGVLIFNRQNSTGDVRVLVDRARARGIPVVAITETPDPATLPFQDWQAGQLEDLRRALAASARRPPPSP